MPKTSLISRPDYEIMGLRVVCKEVQTTRTFALESDLDHWIAVRSRHAGYKYIKVDTVNQIGFPDALLLRGEEYWSIESKLLRRKKLTNLLDNIKWEPGQVPWMLQAILKKQRYILAVAKNNVVMLIGDEKNVNKICGIVQTGTPKLNH